MKPFLNYYGGKYRAAPLYPRPRMDRIVEPFAGAAGYATRHWRHRVLLIDKNPVIVAVWRYLIATPAAEILRLPLLEHDGQRVDDLCCPQEARWLIGFWINKGCAAPRHQLSTWSRWPGKRKFFWGEAVRARLALQVESIRHWRVVQASYESAPDVEATWFVDPPYPRAGHAYPYGARDIDYAQLADWTRRRRGQVIVCSHHGDDWLPFQHLASAKAQRGVFREAIWTPESEGQQALDFGGDA